MTKRTRVHLSSRPSSIGPHLLAVLLVSGGLLSMVLFPGAMTGQAGAQTIYQYMDKNGSVVLTDKPPAGVSAQPVVREAPKKALEADYRDEAALKAAGRGVPTTEEAIRQQGEKKLDEAIKAVEAARTAEARDRERELEKQRRIEEADRLEAEARQPVSATRENRQRQYELMQEAEKLRRAQ